MAPPPSRRLLFGVAVGIVAGFALAWVVLALLAAFACSGDGGSPYAAPASTVGEMCDAREGSPWSEVWVALLVAPIAMLLVAIAVGVRRRDARVMAIGATVSFAILGIVTMPFLVLSDDCSDSEQAAYERGRSVGDESAPDCQSY